MSIVTDCILFQGKIDYSLQAEYLLDNSMCPWKTDFSDYKETFTNSTKFKGI